MHEVIVCSYNLGAGVQDYLCYFSSVSDEHQLQEIETHYREIKERVAQKLVGAADVFCFQEVMEEARPEIDLLVKHRYELVRLTKKSDTALAISPDKFQDITNWSFQFPSGEDVAAASVVEKQSGKKLGFASVHIPGFNLEETDPTQMKEGAEIGDDHVRIVADRLNQIFHDCDFVVLGGDFNAIYERYAHRFQLLEEKGFTIQRTNGPTNKTTNPQVAKILFERELDYFATKVHKSFKSRILTSLSLTKSISAEIVSGAFEPGFDQSQNSSDHLPIYLKVTL